ncbi:MAG: site-2 protease family protein [Acidobacteriia bacterium]|nr:site-2 protease family protein [Terriglobia bacterium]
MFSSGLKIGRIFGIPIYLHASWFLIFALITISIAEYYAQLNAAWTPWQRWVLGIITSILFFGSLLFHELAHSVVALRYQIPVISITLFVFGGLARIGREPHNAKQEFAIAIAGPISSYMLAGMFHGLERVAQGTEMAAALLNWLALINFVLATFNLVPGFPLDGGRILRAAVWGWTQDYTKATRIASRGGQLFAYLLILLGIVGTLQGNLGSGLWLVFIGWFLLSAAQESFAQVAMRNSLRGVRVGDVMSTELPMVARDLSLEGYVQELLRTGRRCHLVVGDGELLGLMTVHALNRVPREDWARTSVQAVMLPPERIHWAAPEEPVLGLLERMQNEDVNQMPVISGGRVVGLISRDTILRVLQTRLELSRLGELAEH